MYVKSINNQNDSNSTLRYGGDIIDKNSQKMKEFHMFFRFMQSVPKNQLYIYVSI